MCRNRAIILFIFALGALLMSMQHKFYLSKTTIEFNRSNGMYEATIKFFTDDLEQALSNATGNAVQFSKMGEADIDAQIIEIGRAHV